MECVVCVENFTQNIRKSIRCPFCDVNVCKKCWRTYFLSLITDPKCLECHKELPSDFLYNNFPSSFMNDELIKSKEKWMVSYYRENLQNLYPTVSRYLKDNEKYLFCPFCVRIFKKPSLRYTEDDTDDTSKVHITKHLCTEKHVLRKLPFKFRNRYYPYFMTQSPTPVQEKITEVIHCPVPECGGLVSDDENCECFKCSISLCRKCHSVKNDNHQCDKNNILNIAEIKKNTKPCPSCHIPIHKISGCYQMWCTRCHTAFDYTTGKIEIRNDRIHNPHYFDYIREKGFDVNENINNFCENRTYSPWALRLLERSRHVRYIAIPLLEEKLNADICTEISYRYLLNKNTEQQWEQTIKRSIKNKILFKVQIQMCNLFVYSANSLIESSEDEITRFDTVFRSLFVNEVKKYTHVKKANLGWFIGDFN